MLDTDTPVAEAPAAVDERQLPMPMTASTEEALLYPCTLFARSPTNPRKTFKPEYIAELSDSIKRVGGVIQPIVGRPNPAHAEGNGQPPYEIVVGECRWRASTLAGMNIRAIIRALTDFEVLEIQIIENMHRQDLDPLEEAEGMKRLLRTPDLQQGYASVEDLAHRLGKSRRWVFDRISLLNLCEPARAALRAHTLSLSIAYLVATMPDPVEQSEATTRIVQGFGGEPMTFLAAKAYLKENFMLNLATAKFDIAAEYPHAGPCGACPKRTGASPDLFAETNGGDMCRDSKCYAAKTSAAHDARLQAGRDAGMRVLDRSAALRLMPSSTALPNEHQWFERPCPVYTDSKRPLNELFGAKARDALMLDHPAGGIIVIVPNTAVIKLLKAKSLLRPVPPAPAPAPAPTLSAAAAAPLNAEQVPAPKTAAEAAPSPIVPRTAAQLASMTETVHGELLATHVFAALRNRLQALDELPLLALRMLILDRMADAYREDYVLLYEAHGWPLPAAPQHSVTSIEVDLQDRLEALSGREVGELLIETLVIGELTSATELDDITDSDTRNQPTRTLANALGIDQAGLEALDREAYDDAHRQVHDEERARLAAAPATDATGAFIAANALDAFKKPPVKYRDPATLATWSGRGLQPKWLKVALDAGKKLSDFEVKA